MSPEPDTSLVRCRTPERRFRDLVGPRQRDGWCARGVAPKRELHAPATDLRDEPTEHELRAEAHRMRRTERTARTRSGSRGGPLRTAVMKRSGVQRNSMSE
jgi:hypothetical protein